MTPTKPEYRDWHFDRFSWAIGLFEGEGTIAISSNGKVAKNRTIAVRVVMADKDTITRFFETVGCGYVRGPHRYKHSKKLMYAWKIGRRKEAIDFILRILPYLSDHRRAQGIRALLFDQTHPVKWNRRGGKEG